MRRTFFSGLVTAAFIAAAASISSVPASAAIVTATYKGTVDYGYDGTGVFGAAGTDLTGDAFTAVYKINDAAPGAYAVSNPPYYSYIYGGSAYGTTSPVSAVVTINGHSLSAGNYAGEAFQAASPWYYSEVYHFAENYSSNANGYAYAYAYNYVYSSSDPFVTSADYHTPLSHQVQPGDYGYGYVQTYAYDYRTGSYQSAYAGLSDSSVTISSGVPELGTWAMMIIGFGGVAVQMRRRDRAVALAA
jgi:hypothetical protein